MGGMKRNCGVVVVGAMLVMNVLVVVVVLIGVSVGSCNLIGIGVIGVVPIGIVGVLEGTKGEGVMGKVDFFIVVGVCVVGNMLNVG